MADGILADPSLRREGLPGDVERTAEIVLRLFDGSSSITTAFGAGVEGRGFWREAPCRESPAVDVRGDDMGASEEASDWRWSPSWLRRKILLIFCSIFRSM
jgi:hypothetical protein